MLFAASKRPSAPAFHSRWKWARLEDLALTIHRHHTPSEAFHKAVLTALGHPLHIWRT
jgi:hypothetical protein